MNGPSQYYLSLFKHLLQLKLSSSPSTQSYAFNDKVFSTDISIFPIIPSNKPNFMLKEQKIEKVDYYREKVLKMKKFKIEKMESKKNLIVERITKNNRKLANTFFGDSNMSNNKTTSIEGRYRQNKSLHQKKDGRGLVEIHAMEGIARRSKSFHKKGSNFFEETIKDENSKINYNKQKDKQSFLYHALNNKVGSSSNKVNNGNSVGSLSTNKANNENSDTIHISDTLQEIVEKKNRIELKRNLSNKIKNFIVKNKLEEKNGPIKIQEKNKDLVK